MSKKKQYDEVKPEPLTFWMWALVINLVWVVGLDAFVGIKSTIYALVLHGLGEAGSLSFWTLVTASIWQTFLVLGGTWTVSLILHKKKVAIDGGLVFLICNCVILVVGCHVMSKLELDVNRLYGSSVYHAVLSLPWTLYLMGLHLSPRAKKIFAN